MATAMKWERLLSSWRLGNDKPDQMRRGRSPFQQDFDRIIFSSSFRRLQDKTQVFPLANTDYVRTRLTHSLEASSIARSLGAEAGEFIVEESALKGVRPADISSIVASATLAHDIGNPPLGHSGEESIRDWFRHNEVGKRFSTKMTAKQCCDFERYEGNAHGFRVLARLQLPEHPGGMQLTCATLGAFAKYPSSSSATVRPPGISGKKFNFFQADAQLFKEVAEHTGMLELSSDSYVRHPLAYLVEAADDIAYRIVDFEDGVMQKLISYEEFETLMFRILKDAEQRKAAAAISDEQRRVEFIRAKVIGVLVKEVAAAFRKDHDMILNGESTDPLIALIPSAEALRLIEESSRIKIYRSSGVVAVLAAGFELFGGLLDIFGNAIEEMAGQCNGECQASYRSSRILPLLPNICHDADDLEWRSSAYIRLLRLLDFITGLTDSAALNLYRQIKGISL